MPTLVEKLPTALQPAPVRRALAADRDARIMGAGLLTMGTLHFVVPKPFDGMVPEELPGSARSMTYASGVAELAIGAGLLYPPTRRASATAAVALFVAVFPGNLNGVRLYWDKPMIRAGMIARLPFQIPMITTALKIRRNCA